MQLQWVTTQHTDRPCARSLVDYVNILGGGLAKWQILRSKDCRITRCPGQQPVKLADSVLKDPSNKQIPRSKVCRLGVQERLECADLWSVAQQTRNENAQALQTTGILTGEGTLQWEIITDASLS